MGGDTFVYSVHPRGALFELVYPKGVSVFLIRTKVPHRLGWVEVGDPRFQCGLCYRLAVFFGPVTVPLWNHRPRDFARGQLIQHINPESVDFPEVTQGHTAELGTPDSHLGALSSWLQGSQGLVSWRLRVSLRKSTGDKRKSGD